MRGVTIQVAADLVTETCCRSDCGILFAVPADWQQRRKSDHTDFFCPNGHSQHYTAKTREEQLRDQLAEAKRSLDYHRKRGDRLEDDKQRLTRSNRALRGVATRLKRRVAAGTCPFCEHQFPDVAAHVQEEHPAELTAAIEDEKAVQAEAARPERSEG